ncbi:MAG TPA: DUF1844 domain-containing protein [Pyrinomonadaceae bacterium]|nr:DUF1844 domain-containing protein [Pyrinomonadaceae bacterium]
MFYAKRGSCFNNDMNEDQPNFKITDRRLFNADGTPREVPAEEKPEPKQEAKPEPKAIEPEPAVSAAQPEPKPEPQASAAAPEEAAVADEEMSQEELAEAQDPASFISLVMSLASNAASALGMMEHPVTHQREVDPELGKHWIDVLGMLQKKTNGNLSRAEKNMLEGLLHDLRMQYVATINAPQKARTFSGKDITGG